MLSTIRCAVAVVVSAATAAAQQPATCSGPGAAFGVTAYQCASCSIKQVTGARTQYVFQAEPIVLETSASSVLKAGDVIEAVNGEPIMTQVGAHRFTYPIAGVVTITARRGNARVQLAATTPGCVDATSRPAQPAVIVDGTVVDDIKGVDPKEIETVEVLKGAAAAMYGPRAINGVILITTKRAKSIREKANEPLLIIDGVVQPSAAPQPGFYLNGRRLDSLTQSHSNSVSGNGRKFGFAIGCLPSCTRVTARDGTAYYKFDGLPPIVELAPGGAAERAGVRKGDLVSQIDGKSILGEDGALRFMRGNKTETLHLTVVREGATIGYLLRAR